MAAMPMTVQYRLGMTPRSVAAMQMGPLALKVLELGAFKSVLKVLGLVAAQISWAEAARPVLYVLPLQHRLERTPRRMATPAGVGGVGVTWRGEADTPSHGDVIIEGGRTDVVVGVVSGMVA